MDLASHFLYLIRSVELRLPRVLLRALMLFSCIAACCAAAVLNPQVATADSGKRDEYSVKAAYIYNLAKFVGWPETAFTDDKQPLELCVLGRSSLRQPFAKLSSRSVQGHPVTPRFIKRSNQVEGCHVVFVANTEKDKLEELLNLVAGKATLTISDVEGFFESGGMISLIRSGNKIGFNVNVKAADAAALTISSKLLRLAKNVKTASK